MTLVLASFGALISLGLLLVAPLYFATRSNRESSHEKRLNKEYDEKFTKMYVEEQKDIQKIKNVQNEYIEKHHKAKENQFNNEESYVCRIIRNEQELELESDEMTFRPLRIETVKAKDIEDQSRILCKTLFPKAYLEVPDYDLSMQREHKMLHYQMYLWKKKRSNNFINLN